MYTLPRDMKAELDIRRIIFTVTAGRSGTAFLSYLMNHIPNVKSFHEPKPQFHEVMRLVQKNIDIAYEFWIDRKLPEIIITEQNSVYVETSHLFCKGFAEPLLNLGFVPDIIILTRPHRQVARSLYQVAAIPGRTERALTWYLSPEDPQVVAPANWQSLTDYQLCYWYCLEIERRSELYASMFSQRGARVARTSIDDIKSVQGFRRLIDDLMLVKPSIHGWIKYLRNRNRRINIKAGEKQEREIPDNADEQEMEVRGLLGMGS